MFKLKLVAIVLILVQFSSSKPTDIFESNINQEGTFEDFLSKIKEDTQNFDSVLSEHGAKIIQAANYIKNIALEKSRNDVNRMSQTEPYTLDLKYKTDLDFFKSGPNF